MSGEQTTATPSSGCRICGIVHPASPTNSECRECGLTSAELLFRTDTPPAWWAFGLPTALVVFVTVAQMLSVRPTTGIGNANVLWGFGIATVVGAALTWALRRGESFMATTKRGITYRHMFGQIRSIPWDELLVSRENASLWRFVDGKLKILWPPHVYCGRAVRHAAKRHITTEWHRRMVNQDTGEPKLRYCATCGYDLRLLAATHRCPECGFHYNPTTVVWWEFPWSAGPYLMIFLLTIFLAGSASDLSELMTRGTLARAPNFPWSIFLTLMKLWNVLFMLLCLRYLPTKLRFLALGEGGITFTNRWGSVRTIDWSDITIPKRHPTLVFERANGKSKRLRIPLLEKDLRRTDSRTRMEEFTARWRATNAPQTPEYPSAKPKNG